MFRLLHEESGARGSVRDARVRAGRLWKRDGQIL